MTGKNNRVKSTNDIELKDRLVAINRVTKVTKGGRTFSFSAIVVVGNEAGIVGWGLGKASEVTTAIAKGVEAAKKNLVKVPVLKGTIPHDQLAKFGGALVYIKPASPGTGVKAGGAMRAVLESVGITDVLAKSKGSSNPHNLVKATIAALCELRDAATVAQNRGISVEKVFKGSYGGQAMEKRKIKQVKSRINCPAVQKKTLDALGLKKLNSVVEHNATPQILGMVEKVKHLVKVVE